MRKPYQVRAATHSANKNIPVSLHCGKSAAQEELFKDEGVTAIEKYCSACMEPRMFERLKTIYNRVH